MNKMCFYLQLFVFLLAAGTIKASANTYSNIPQHLTCNTLNKEIAEETLPIILSDDTDKTWKILTQEDSDQVVTLHLSQQLVFIICADIWTDLSHFTSEITCPNLLKETLGGDLLSVKDGSKTYQALIFQPVSTGQTVLNIIQNKDVFWKKSYANFTINIVK